MNFSENAVLLIIDVQKGFSDTVFGKRNNLNAEANIQQLIEVWRNNKRPVIFIQHASKLLESPFYPNKPGYVLQNEIKPRPDELLIVKNENSAFVNTDLEAHLKTRGLRDIVTVGLTTDHCVSTTVRMGQNLGFNMFVVADATATFDRIDYQGKLYPAQTMHEINLASLHKEFATIIDTAAILKSQ
ncbi:MAG: isochorismatase [Gammaproteobacteria bacterium RIFCSPHIGHO2_12_FULL_35_23]|nr:MAG: isochorismatase [Gammaproteobacteria bacterium RIFCSPHIGHO2_12_FULL_35_23]